MRKSIVTCFLLVCMLIVTAFPSMSFAEKVLRIGIAKEPANLNPVLVPGLFGESIAGNIFDTLVSYKESSKEAAPLLATSWTISDDNTVYTFTLRKDVRFHDGTPLTAADVKFTFEAILDEKNASPSRQFFEPVASIETPGMHTVRITMKEPYAPFLLALGNPASGIVPAGLVRSVGMDAFDRAPVGTGPFVFAEWVPDDKIVLEKNPDYFLGASHLDKVVFRPIPKPEVMAAELLSGGIDIGSDLLPQDIERLEKEGLRVASVSGLTYRYLGFSSTIAPFSDIRFRKAVYHAVPFEQAIPGIFRSSGERAYSWIPPGVLGDDIAYMRTKALPFDMAKAKALFDELKAENVLQEGFTFDIYTMQDPQRVKVATVISTQLRQAGLNAQVKPLEWGSFFPLLKAGTCGMYVMGWGSVPDPDRWTYKIFMPDSTLNFSKYTEPEVAEALKAGRVETAPAARTALYTKAMRKALAEDYIHIPLAFMRITNVMNTQVQDFAPSAQGYIHLVTVKRNVDIR